MGRPACVNASAARIMPWSIISIAAGTTPEAMISLTVSPPSATVAKSSSMVRTAGGLGVRRTQMRVAIPIVPSLPTKSPRRS